MLSIRCLSCTCVVNSHFLQYVIIAVLLLQVVQLLQSFSLYTEQLDRSTLVKPDVENRMWLLTADRTPYTEGVVLFPFVGRHFHATTFTFGHIACLDDDADAKMILMAPPPNNWKRPPGRPRITWLNTIQRDLRAYNLTPNETIDLDQNRRLWRLMSTCGAPHS